MGGYGTLIYALKYPDLFAAAAPLSAANFDDDAISQMPDANSELLTSPYKMKRLFAK